MTLMVVGQSLTEIARQQMMQDGVETYKREYYPGGVPLLKRTSSWLSFSYWRELLLYVSVKKSQYNYNILWQDTVYLWFFQLFVSKLCILKFDLSWKLTWIMCEILLFYQCFCELFNEIRAVIFSNLFDSELSLSHACIMPLLKCLVNPSLSKQFTVETCAVLCVFQYETH